VQNACYNILMITDGKAGHESSSRGIIDLIQTRHCINVYTLNVKLRVAFFKYILKELLNKVNFQSKRAIKMLHWVAYTHTPLPTEQIHFIVSAGGNTSFSNILLAQYFHAPNFFSSQLRGLKPHLFSHIASLQSHNYPNEIVLELAPIYCRYDVSALVNFRSEYALNDNEKIWAILIGGNSNEYHFDSNDYTTMVEKLISLAQRHKAKLLLTTSRRTPIEVEKKLQSLIMAHPTICIKSVLYNHYPEKITGIFLQLSEVIFCTEDSGSMITEAILGHKKVYTCYPKQKISAPHYDQFLNNNIQNHYSVSVAISDLENLTLSEKFSLLYPLPVEKVYDEISYIFTKEP